MREHLLKRRKSHERIFRVAVQGREIQLIASNTDDYFVQLERGPLPEPETLAVWAELSRGCNVIDVGACSSLYALTAASAGASRVLAIEPNPWMASRLERATALNGFTQILVKAIAAEKSRDHAEVMAPRLRFRSESTRDSSGTQLRAADSGRDLRRWRWLAEVDSARLDDVHDSALGRVAPIKIDTEDHELKALRGSERLLTVDRPALLLEAWNSETGRLVSELLQSLDYRPGCGLDRYNQMWLPT